MAGREAEGPVEQGKGWVCFLSPPSPAPLEVSVETAAEKGRVKVTQPEPKRGRVEGGDMREVERKRWDRNGQETEREETEME